MNYLFLRKRFLPSARPAALPLGLVCSDPITLQSGVAKTIPETTDDLWFRYVAPAAGVVTLQAATENAGTVEIYASIGDSCYAIDNHGTVYDGGWNGAVDTPHELAVAAGQILYVVVYGTGVAPGSTLTMTFRAGVVVRNDAGVPFRNDAGRIFTQAA